MLIGGAFRLARACRLARQDLNYPERFTETARGFSTRSMVRAILTMEVSLPQIALHDSKTFELLGTFHF
jgi:hypothetical protein